VYQGQKVHLFRPSLGFLAEARPRLENRRKQIYFVFTFIKQINLLFIILLYIYYIFTVFVISLPTKRKIYYLQYNYVLIYIIYSDKTIIGFIGFVANLLSRPRWRHGQRPKKCVRKRVAFRPLVSKITGFIKSAFRNEKKSDLIITFILSVVMSSEVICFHLCRKFLI
jgi:hypothetical protein